MYYPTLIQWLCEERRLCFILILKVEKMAHLLLEQFVSPRINSPAYKNGNEYKFSDLHELVFYPQTLLIPRVETWAPPQLNFPSSSSSTAYWKDIIRFSLFKPLGNFQRKTHSIPSILPAQIALHFPPCHSASPKESDGWWKFGELVRQQTHYGVYYKSQRWNTYIEEEELQL